MKYVKFKREDWNYLCSRINFGDSFLDAKAIRIMNEPIIEEVEEDAHQDR